MYCAGLVMVRRGDPLTRHSTPRTIGKLLRLTPGHLFNITDVSAGSDNFLILGDINTNSENWGSRYIRSGHHLLDQLGNSDAILLNDPEDVKHSLKQLQGQIRQSVLQAKLASTDTDVPFSANELEAVLLKKGLCTRRRHFHFLLLHKRPTLL